MGYNPINITDVLLHDARRFPPPIPDYWKETKAKYEKHRAKTQSNIDKMPSHYQFLKDNIYVD